MVTALKIDISQIPGIDGERGTLKRPSLFVNRTSRIFLGSPKKRTPEDETATPSAPHAFPFSELLLVLNIRGIQGAEQKPPDLICELAQRRGAAWDEPPQTKASQGWKRHIVAGSNTNMNRRQCLFYRVLREPCCRELNSSHGSHVLSHPIVLHEQ
jgi:hypothetical protein